MKRYLLCLLVLPVLVQYAPAEEINGEVNVSFIDPYERFAPGFCVSFRPEMLDWRGLSLGAGLALHISSRFKYETTEAQAIPDTTNWYYFNENLTELANFDLFAEGRWQFLGRFDERNWKGWVTVNAGLIINSAQGTTYQTQYEVDGDYIVSLYKYVLSPGTEYRTESYISPGLLFGAGNFIFGYRHWFFPESAHINRGQPGRMAGTVRLGYRFTW